MNTRKFQFVLPSDLEAKLQQSIHNHYFRNMTDAILQICYDYYNHTYQSDREQFIQYILALLNNITDKELLKTLYSLYRDHLPLDLRIDQFFKSNL